MIIHACGRRYYDVPEEAYKYCKRCHTVADAWKYTDLSNCPICGYPLSRYPTPLDRPIRVPESVEAKWHEFLETNNLYLDAYYRLQGTLLQCEEDGCFGEGFAYPTPLRPTLLIRHGNTFTDEYGGERTIEKGA